MPWATPHTAPDQVATDELEMQPVQQDDQADASYRSNERWITSDLQERRRGEEA
jgi:hypothetical protein